MSHINHFWKIHKKRIMLIASVWGRRPAYFLLLLFRFYFVVYINYSVNLRKSKKSLLKSQSKSVAESSYTQACLILVLSEKITMIFFQNLA